MRAKKNNRLGVTKNALQTINIAKKIKGKYNVMKTKTTIKLLQNKEQYTNLIINNLDYVSQIKKRLEADKLVTSCIYLRDNFNCRIEQNLKNCQKKIEIQLSRLGGMPISGNEGCALTALCGYPKHTASSESYYQTSYDYEKILTEKTVSIVNSNGQVENILPLINDDKVKIKSWYCEDHCKTADPD